VTVSERHTAGVEARDDVTVVVAARS
jgi:hypothetical protein